MKYNILSRELALHVLCNSPQNKYSTHCIKITFIASSSDLQPSTAIANQLLDKLV